MSVFNDQCCDRQRKLVLSTTGDSDMRLRKFSLLELYDTCIHYNDITLSLISSTHLLLSSRRTQKMKNSLNLKTLKDIQVSFSQRFNLH